MLPGIQVDKSNETTMKKWTEVCNVSLNFFSIYFLILEIPQIRFQIQYIGYKSYKFFLSAEKLTIFATPALILYNTINQDLDQPSFWTIQAWSALMLFLRFALYLRVFEGFGWLIHLVVNSLISMTVFMVVLIIGIFAFADAFMSIDRKLELQGRIDPVELSENASNYEKYWQGYVHAIQNSFIVAIGEFDYHLNIESFNENEWLIFMLCAVFNVVLLLNLLIAIISETYEKISMKKPETKYKEKAILVSKMQQTTFGFFN